MQNTQNIRKIISYVFIILMAVLVSACSMDLSVEGLSVNQEVSRAATTGPKKPFPQNETFPGIIRPAGLSDSQINNDITSLYDSWKNQYVKSMTFINGDKHNSFTGYFIEADANGWVPPSWSAAGVGPITQSEAHGYGMLITALMAGYDNQAKDIFDKMYQLAINFPSSNNPDLMCWIIPTNGDLSIERNGSATDGDMDIAYALLLADKQWGGGPDIPGMSTSYKQEAVRVINGLAASNIFKKNELGNTGPHFPRLAVGDMPHTWSGVKYIDHRTTRSSDWMLGHFEAFADASGDSVWTDLKAVTEDIILKNQASTGLVADFYNNQVGQYSAEVSTFEGVSDEAGGQYDDDYYYNSCRFPFRIAMAYAQYNNQAAKTALNKLNNWVQTKAPADIKGGFSLNGVALSEWYSAAFCAPFMAGLSAYSDASVLRTYWDHVKGYIPPDQWGLYYYENSITLLTMLYVSGNWWSLDSDGDIPPVDTEAPTTPGTPVAGSINSDSISFSWQASSDNVGVAGYYVYQNGAQVAQVSGSTTSYTARSLASSSAYSFAVQAFDAIGNMSSLSNSLTATTTDSQDTGVPTLPGTPVIGEVTTSSISFSWQASTDNVGVSGYFIFQDAVQIAQVGSNSLSYTAAGLSPETSYTFSVKAFDAAGNVSGMSGQVSAVTDAEQQGGDSDVTADYSINSWGSGYTATITITNNSDTAISGWTAQWEYASQTVSTSWSCSLVQNGTRVTVTPVSWNSTIPAGGSISFGYNGIFNGEGGTPVISVTAQ